MNLLDCPFCGENSPELEDEREWQDRYHISCGYCGASGSRQEEKEEAIKSWNTRPKPSCDKDYKQAFEDAKRILIEALDKV